MSTLDVSLAGVALAGPVVAAAGAAGNGPEILSAVPAGTFGAVTTKSITPEPRPGHPPWRVVEVRSGMLNAVGLANPGLDSFMTDVVPQLAAGKTTFIGSIAGHSLEDYVAMARAFEPIPDLPLVEANLSCPNTHTGRQFTDDPAAMRDVVSAIKSVLPTTPLLVKLPLEMTPGFPIAMAAVEAGADGLTMINTVPALAIDVESRRPRLSNRVGGQSGPGVHHLAIRMVSGIHAEVGASIPIVGLGGIMRWQDAAEFILAGATAVGMATALYVDPRLAARVTRGLRTWVVRQRAATLRDLVGAVHTLPEDPR